jgi:hypothetical protein
MQCLKILNPVSTVLTKTLNGTEKYLLGSDEHVCDPEMTDYITLKAGVWDFYIHDQYIWNCWGVHRDSDQGSSLRSGPVPDLKSEKIKELRDCYGIGLLEIDVVEKIRKRCDLDRSDDKVLKSVSRGLSKDDAFIIGGIKRRSTQKMYIVKDKKGEIVSWAFIPSIAFGPYYTLQDFAKTKLISSFTMKIVEKDWLFAAIDTVPKYDDPLYTTPFTFEKGEWNIGVYPDIYRVSNVLL